MDMNGKRFAWQGVALLPFIEEDRLLREVKKVEHTLTEEERHRNSSLSDLLYVAGSHPLAPAIYSLVHSFGHLEGQERAGKKEEIAAEQRWVWCGARERLCAHTLTPSHSHTFTVRVGGSGGMNGFLFLCEGDACPTVLRAPYKGVGDIHNNHTT